MDCARHDPTVDAAGQTSETAGASKTVNVELHVEIVGGHDEVNVHVTVFDPPQIAGAPVLSLVRVVLHPPLDVTPPNHAAYALVTVDCA